MPLAATVITPQWQKQKVRFSGSEKKTILLIASQNQLPQFYEVMRAKKGIKS